MIWSPRGAGRDDQEVDGWHLEYDDMVDDDCVKIWYEAVHRDGRRQVLDWSSYDDLPHEAFQMMVRLGFPRRTGIGPLNMAELRRLNEEAQERAERAYHAALDAATE